MTRPPTEILVHIAAASRASDDVRYRALAEAYGNFEPAERVNVASFSSSVVSSFTEFRQPVSSAGIVPYATIVAGSSFETVNLSFDSVWDNVQSPGVVPAPLPAQKHHQPLQKRHQHYVSPHDYIPDSQSQDERRTRRKTLDDERVDEIEFSQRIYDVSRIDDSRIEDSRIEESQEVLSSRPENDSDCESNIWIRNVASPDLSAMPMDITHLSESILEDSQEQEQQQPHPPRQPLTQRSANSQQSSQNDDDVAFLKSSPPLHEWDAIPSSTVASSPDLGAGQPHSFTADVPSSLPEESGKVIIRVDTSSRELRGPSANLSSSMATGLTRAESEPIRTKRQRESDYVSAERPGLDRRQQNLDTRRASDSEQPPQKKQREEPVIEPNTAIAIMEKTTTVAPKSAIRDLSQPFPSSSPTASAPGLYLDHSLRIISPDPPVACEHLNPAALITEKMAKLARDLDLERRYRPLPSSDSRAIRPFERGYWRLNTAGWPASLRHQAWSFLKTYIGAGDAGWSVWCSRDPAPHTWLRLSCFAATAGHTYLILYLASRRQILTTGAVWMDGSGTPTITVPPRKKKQTSGSVDVFTNAY
ncbi:hypothetical protein Sste5346_007421 [Sporothrix stenoceras]|uniref:Uncharacterized protein n=1 Tax=Sporothrix stenoceras TaxID=5173 RepID=A0ABR3YU42_9PEZI